MKRRIATRDQYDKTASGILVPAGSTTEALSFTKTNFAATKLDGLELLKLFKSNGLDSSRSPSLMNLIHQTSELSDALLTMQVNPSREQVFAAMQLRRVIDAVDAIKNDEALPERLSELLDGTLDLLFRKQSKAKDTLWELELLRTFRSNGVSAEFGEPDLVLTVSTYQMGVACKKLYSSANFSKVISQAVKQIEQSSRPGIVAFNLDDLIPPKLRVPTAEIAERKLNTELANFMAHEERHLRRYIEPGRAIAVTVSCAALAELDRNEPRFCNFRQRIAWHIPSISPEIDGQFKAIISAFKSGAPSVTPRAQAGAQ